MALFPRPFLLQMQNKNLATLTHMTNTERQINLTSFGQNLIASSTSDSHPAKPSQTGDSDDESLWDKIKGGAEDLGDDISGTINNITNEIAGDVAEELGIAEWYSLHIMTLCQGMFEGNDSAHASYNLTNCTAQGPGRRMCFCFFFCIFPCLLVYCELL